MADYVVVGAGSAGCAVAARLSEDRGSRVVLLEAGGRDRRREVSVPAAFSKLFGTEADWAYETVPQPALDDRRLYWPRGKMLGGSSSLNAQMHVRGNAADFDGWAEAGNDGWSHAEVLEHFRRAEDHAGGSSDHHGAGGAQRVERLRDPNPMTLAFLDAAAEVGIWPNPDVNAESQEGAGLTWVTQRRGKRHSSADAYLRPARRRRNLEVVVDAHVTRLLIDDGRVAGVAHRDPRGDERVVLADREVVLCAGAIGSPQLLLCSGIGPRHVLAEAGVEPVHELPGVGLNLLDHLAVPLVSLVDEPVSLVSAESPRNLVRYLLGRRGPLSSNVGEAHAFVALDDDASAPDIELVFAPVAFLEHGLVEPPDHGLTVGVVLLQPRSRGHLAITSPRVDDPPVIDPAYLTDPHDVRVLLEGVRLGRRLLDAPPLRAWIREPFWPGEGGHTDEDLVRFIRKRAETLYHPVGTCRMGVDDLAVVDPRLRVRGLAGLRVADASVMPTVPRGHTHAPTVMIAEKAAELLRGSHPG